MATGRWSGVSACTLLLLRPSGVRPGQAPGVRFLTGLTRPIRSRRVAVGSPLAPASGDGTASPAALLPALARFIGESISPAGGLDASTSLAVAENLQDA